MSTLNSLKLTNTKRPQAMPAVLIRRHKLMKKLHEQQMLAEAVATGKTYAATRLKNVIDTDTGLTKTVEVPRRVRAWWWTAEDGKICLNVKYGSSCLQIAKGKFAIEILFQTGNYLQQGRFTDTVRTDNRNAFTDRDH